MANHVLVIGGGPAGILAACTAAQNGAEVTLIERNDKIGKKLRITGKGRCNLTNAGCETPRDLIEHVPGNGRFLYSAFSAFGPADSMALLESLGVPLKVERGNRVFPVSDKAQDIVDALDRYLDQCGVSRITGRVEQILTDSKTVCGLKLKEQGNLYGNAVILATGGKSYPKTGSTGDGYRLAKQLGHTVTALRPSLVALESSDPWCPKMQGLSLKNISVRFVRNNKVLYEDFGELLFTHFGISGPVVLSGSAHLRNVDVKDVTVYINWKPALSREKLDERILRDFSENANRDFKNSLSHLLPAKAIPVFVERSGIPEDKKVNQITKEERNRLLDLFQSFAVPLSGFRPIDEAIVTAGGVSVKEVDPKTMQSKLVPGLYFAGEVLDVDAYTGGFNIQIALSTGYLAGRNASKTQGEE